MLLQPEVPDHAQTLFAITTDPEATRAGISLVVKHEPWGEATIGDYRDDLRASLANTMLRARLAELTRQADPPFSGAFAMDRRMARTKGMFMLARRREGGRHRPRLRGVLTELERARRHGFTEGELERAKAEMLRQSEQAAAEMDKTESQRLARDLQMHFLRGTPYSDPAQELALERDLLPGIGLDEVEARLHDMTGQGSRVVTVEAPRRDGLVIPDEAALSAIMEAVMARDIPAYVDQTVDAPLVPATPGAGRHHRT